MTDRSRQAWLWLAVAAILFLGLLLLFLAAQSADETATQASQDLSWPVLQTMVAFVLFDVALLAGLLLARLRSRPASLSPRGLLILAAAASFLALALLAIVLDWPLAPADLLWTLVLISGFGFLLALGVAWSTWRASSEPVQPTLDAAEPQPVQSPAEPDAVADDEPTAQAMAEPSVDTAEEPATYAPAPEMSVDDPSPSRDEPLAYLTGLLDGDSAAAERLVAHEQTLDPGASHKECIARAIYKTVRTSV